MANTKYAFQGYDEKSMAKALGRGLSISTKKSVEVCNWIKGKPVNRAKQMLQDVIDLKKAVPYKRFNQELAHQKATGPGGFPVNVCKEILALVKSAEANANSKGLNTDGLKIVHVCSHLGSRPFRFGRKRRVKAKRTTVEVVLKEVVSSKKKDSKKENKQGKSDKKQVSKESKEETQQKKSEDKKVVAKDVKESEDKKSSSKSKVDAKDLESDEKSKSQSSKKDDKKDVDDAQ